MSKITVNFTATGTMGITSHGWTIRLYKNAIGSAAATPWYVFGEDDVLWGKFETREAAVAAVTR